MPVSYPIPPWLRGVDPNQVAATYSAGLARGAQARYQQQQIEVEKQKIAESARRANMQFALAKEQQQQRSMQADHALEVRKAYEDAMMGMRERALGNAEQKLQQQTQDAARKLMAQQAYESDVQSLIGKGIPEEKARVTSAMRHGVEMGMSPQGLGTLASSVQPKPDIEARQMRAEQRRSLEADRRAVMQEQAKLAPIVGRFTGKSADELTPGVRSLKQRYDELQAKIDDYDKQLKELRSGGGGRVKVRDLNGKTGTIPESQIDQLPEGWTLLP